MTAKQAQFSRDVDLWETNRMLTSGVAQRTETDMDFDESDQVGNLNFFANELNYHLD
jgi:pre-mRNA-splicing factor ATP-dependent RNA helicase DHX38/PRP16